MSDHLTTIGDQFRRLAPEAQLNLARRFGLTNETAVVEGRQNVWLLRAHFREVLGDLGRAMKEVSRNS